MVVYINYIFIDIKAFIGIVNAKHNCQSFFYIFVQLIILQQSLKLVLLLQIFYSFRDTLRFLHKQVQFLFLFIRSIYNYKVKFKQKLCLTCLLPVQFFCGHKIFQIFGICIYFHLACSASEFQMPHFETFDYCEKFFIIYHIIIFN